MREENSKYIIENFPFLNNSFFKKRFSLYGMECGDGWFVLLKELFENLLALKIPGLEVWVVKEKCGMLCISAGIVTDEATLLIREAEKKSSTICEICGQPGRLKRIRMQPTTRCDECRKAPSQGL